MKAVRIEKTGGPEVLVLVEVPTPTPGPGEIRIRHEAIGLNFIETYQRSGLYPMPLPTGLGQEAAGVVEAVGEGVTRFSVGDRAGYCTGPAGAYAEASVVKADRAVHIPDAISTGVPMKTIKALRYGHEEDLSPAETLLVKYIRQVVSGTVDDETYAKVEQAVGGERGIVEYTGFILWLNWIMRMMQALNTGTMTEDEVDKMIADLESGAMKPADYRLGTSTPMSRFDR